MAKYRISFDTSIGNLTVEEEDGGISQVYFTGYESRQASFLEEITDRKTPLLAQAEKELGEYARGQRSVFHLPLCSKGTAFQKNVWDALCTIPYGETRSYRQIAEQVGSPKGYRAVGMANHNNPISIIVPCHRVVGSNGSLTGYAGGLEHKQMLLELEARRGHV